MIIQREQFEAWLFAQPDSRKFNYTDNQRCLVGSYLTEMTAAKNVIVFVSKFSVDGETYAMPQWLDSSCLDCHQSLLRYVRENNRGYVIFTAGKVKQCYRNLFGDPTAYEPEPNPRTNSSSLSACN